MTNIKRPRGRPKGVKNKHRSLRTVPLNKAFYVNDGAVLRSLFDLANKLEHISEESFRHHVREEQDDFKIWIKDTIQDIGLARKLASSDDKNSHHIIILKHIIKKLR